MRRGWLENRILIHWIWSFLWVHHWRCRRAMSRCGQNLLLGNYRYKRWQHPQDKLWQCPILGQNHIFFATQSEKNTKSGATATGPKRICQLGDTPKKSFLLNHHASRLSLIKPAQLGWHIPVGSPHPNGSINPPWMDPAPQRKHGFHQPAGMSPSQQLSPSRLRDQNTIRIQLGFAHLVELLQQTRCWT